ncbi:DUF7210 family protein [Sulfurivermis fontis]|uniref:DUF7210 family protein n=1 Tax=Sulfurivermis fontis TaxID=1972068 RepID=UPI000FD83E3C|nr:hypothetical protein [Sulfurivermis fontis]
MPKLKLKVTHTHAGVAYPAGHVIDVDEHTARWMIDHQIGEMVIQRHAQTQDAPTATAKTTKPIEE